jgi:hypothetical protein
MGFMEFLQAGGAPVWAILVFGAANLIASAVFSYRPSKRLLGTIIALACSVLFSVAAGTMADLAAVGMHIAERSDWYLSPKLPLLVLQGFAESMVPGILGFTLLSLVALACAVGLRRMP